jgi:hypothetical protein
VAALAELTAVRLDRDDKRPALPRGVEVEAEAVNARRQLPLLLRLRLVAVWVWVG